MPDEPEPLPSSPSALDADAGGDRADGASAGSRVAPAATEMAGRRTPESARPFDDLLGGIDNELRVRLPVFEGPLDLLLFLIRKSEIDIYDIPIETVTRQYLGVLRAMDRMKLEIAGEFFVMAASLMEIKSRLLLPRDLQARGESTEEEDTADPRWDLVNQLLQYQKFKEAAGGLRELIRQRQDLLPRSEGAAEAAARMERPLQPVDRLELWGVFNLVLRRLADRLVVGEIHDEQVTIVDQMELVLSRIEREASFEFIALFPDKTTFYTVVVTFLAVLELARLKRVSVVQSLTFGSVFVHRRHTEGAAQPVAAESGAADAAAAPADPAPLPLPPSATAP